MELIVSGSLLNTINVQYSDVLRWSFKIELLR